jgi:hypothetical protein
MLILLLDDRSKMQMNYRTGVSPSPVSPLSLFVSEMKPL